MAHDNLKVYNGHVPIDGATNTLVIESFNRATVPIIVFNFDPNADKSIHGLSLGEFFLNPHHNREALIISITESEPGCNGALSSKDLNYHINVTHLKQSEYIKDYPTKYERIGSTLLQQIFDDYSIYAIEDFYNNLEKLLLQQARKIGVNDQSVLYFLEGFFYNTIFYESYYQQRSVQIDKFSSRTAYSVHLRFTNLIMEINIFNTLFVGGQANRDPNFTLPEAFEYRKLNFLYQYNESSGRVYICSNGTSYAAITKRQIYSQSSAYDPNLKSITRGKCGIDDQEDFAFKLLPEFYKTFFSVDGKLHEIVNAKRNWDLSTYLVDDLENVYELNTDLLSAAVMAQSIYSIREDYIEDKGKKMKRSAAAGQKSSNAKLSTTVNVKHVKPPVVKTAVQGLGKVSGLMSRTFLKSNLLPGIGLVLSAKDLFSAVENLRNGDTSASAIFDVTTAAIGLVLGVVDLILPGGGTTVKYILFAISSFLYATSNVKRAFQELERVSSVIEIGAWQKPFEFFSVLFTGSLSKNVQKAEKDKSWNDQMMINALQMMTLNQHVQGFITSAGCYENGQHGPCSTIYVDLVTPVPLISSQQMPSDPSIPTDFKYGFTKTCHIYGVDTFWIKEYMKGNLTIGILNTALDRNKWYNPTGDQTYICNNAFGIQRKHVNNKPNDITIYNLNGNSIIFASSSTNNVFQLSNGNFCRIEGGTKQNVFKFTSFFGRCTILGSYHSLNTLDISKMEYEFKTLLIGNETDAIFFNWFRLEIGRIYMKNMNNFVIKGGKDVRDLIIDCRQQVRGVEVMETSDCQEPLYNIVLANTDCVHDLHIESHGCVRINSRAVKKGHITYTFDGLNGDSEILLQHSPGLTHKIVMTSFDVHEFDLTIWNYTDHTTLVFSNDDKSLRIQILGATESVELSLGGGLQMGLENGLFRADLYFLQSKGQLWYKYRKVFSSMNFMINAYSHRDREAFVLENGLIRFGKKQLQFHAHVANGTEKIRCKAGYNLVVIEPLCEPLWKIFMKKLSWFNDIEIFVRSKIRKLTIDLTLVCDVMNQWYKYYSLSIESLVVGQNINLTVYAILETEIQTVKYKVGVIRLIDVMVDQKYQKVVIISTSDFTLVHDQKGNILTKPLTKIIDSVSPVMLIDPALIEQAQTFLFKGRTLTNYDLVLYQNTTLIITNLASDVFKTLTLSNASPYFYTVILKNFTDEKMRTIKLEFEDGMIFDLMKFNPKQAISYTDFIQKLHVFAQYIRKKTSIMNNHAAFENVAEKIMPVDTMGGLCLPMEATF
uniref:Uncharacterized protein n=1 Tax=Romanomermis culicivorax TaxID=13658 RepID=A0A915HI34_ROMCU